MPQRLARDAAPTVVFGSLESEYLAIQVFGRVHGASDYDIGNWVDAEVRLQTHGLGGAYRAELRSEEFERLRDGLMALYKSLRGRASFDNMDGWLTVEIEGDGFGHCDLKYRVMPSLNPQTVLESCMQLDQTYLPAVIDQLSRVLATFPVIGDRPRPPHGA